MANVLLSPPQLAHPQQQHTTHKRPRSFWDTVLEPSQPQLPSQLPPSTIVTPPISPVSPLSPTQTQTKFPTLPSLSPPQITDLASAVTSPVSNFTESSLQLPITSTVTPSSHQSTLSQYTLSPIGAISKPVVSSKPHTCPTCSSSFARTSHLRLHIRTIHEKLKPFQCEQCPAAFGHVSSKYRHFRTVHLKRRDFSCERCGQTFAERSAVLKHCRTVHEGSRPYPCPTCGFRFHFKLHLSQHISTVHEKQRPHQCSICNACFGQRSSLNRHSRQIHGVSTKK